MILLSVEINFLILKVIVVIAAGMMLSVILSICGTFALRIRKLEFCQFSILEEIQKSFKLMGFLMKDCEIFDII